MMQAVLDWALHLDTHLAALAAYGSPSAALLAPLLLAGAVGGDARNFAAGSELRNSEGSM